MLIAMWSVVTVVFIVMRLSGDPVPLLLPPDAPIAEMERLRHEMGLDGPILVQYGVFVKQAIRGPSSTKRLLTVAGWLEIMIS